MKGPIATGNTAEIYLNDAGHAVKVYKEGFLADVVLKEAEKQRYIHSLGIPVPEVLELTTFNGRQALVMEYIEGETLGDLAMKDRTLLEDYLSVSVEIQMMIHEKDAPGLEPMTDKLTRQLHDASSLSSEEKMGLLKQVDQVSGTKLCHGDFHLFNLVETEDGIRVLDWVDASSGDIRADVVRTYLLYVGFNQEIAEQYLALYCEKSGLRREEILQWGPMIAGARLSENVPGEDADRLLEIVLEGLAKQN
ncbi:aminoglycoside phosphotransferase [Rossellomorea marisflavi]|uniref:phosphotransferase family protein n=1 Tax=Rossellomorea marisflavi TaxID=189381 RepID=UPI0025C7F18D|nr:aminoglycoside phosphotransferase family protein [Rossellomorea marisflavi]GLI86001.1 aminoglycoside phosphotransferase [Rossellomorea marisflavi]